MQILFKFYANKKRMKVIIIWIHLRLNYAKEKFSSWDIWISKFLSTFSLIWLWLRCRCRWFFGEFSIIFIKNSIEIKNFLFNFEAGKFDGFVLTKIEENSISTSSKSKLKPKFPVSLKKMCDFLNCHSTSSITWRFKRAV